MRFLSAILGAIWLAAILLTPSGNSAMGKPRREATPAVGPIGGCH